MLYMIEYVVLWEAGPRTPCRRFKTERAAERLVTKLRGGCVWKGRPVPPNPTARMYLVDWDLVARMPDISRILSGIGAAMAVD